MARSGTAGSQGSSPFSFFFWENPILFSTVTVPIYSPTNSVWVLPFLLFLVNICYLYFFFYNNHFDRLGCKPVNPNRHQRWILIGRTDAEAPVLWPCSAKSQPIGKDPDAGKDWRQEEKGVTEDEMAGWYHWLNGHESEQNLGDSEGQGSLVCCSPWGHKESDMT